MENLKKELGIKGNLKDLSPDEAYPLKWKLLEEMEKTQKEIEELRRKARKNILCEIYRLQKELARIDGLIEP